MTIAKLHETLAIAKPAPAIPPAVMVVPANGMPPGRLERIIVHWTAGQHRTFPPDKSH